MSPLPSLLFRQGKRGPAVAAVAVVAFMAVCQGCSPITRHKILSTVFDGVPSLPPPEQLCADQIAKVKEEILLNKEEKKDKPKSPEASGKEGLTHQPYAEKRCDDCHNKEREEGLIAPRRELCGVCHSDFASGAFVHGPVAVGDCLACHLPHTSSHSPLLKTSKGEVCSICHREKRIAEKMHDELAKKQMNCVDCHDPHFGNIHYFLK